MNKFDEQYRFRIAKKSDISTIMIFIDQFWRKNHILARDRRLFEYQHLYGDTVSFLLAERKTTDEIEGVLGFIPASSDTDKMDVWTAIWKVRDDHSNMPMLGVELMKRLRELIKCRNLILVGANPETAVPIAKVMMKYKAERMKHFYMLGYHEEFLIAYLGGKKSEKSQKICEIENLQYEFVWDEKDFLDSLEYVKVNLDQAIPYKDMDYYVKRYFRHPYYRYMVCHAVIGDRHAIVIMREVEINGRRLCRIVDFIGEQRVFGALSKMFHDLLKKNQYEYVDFYCMHFNEEYILQAGFIERKEKDEVIIPNYMEPFVRQNVEIYVCFKDKQCLVYKADGDQDRPN